MKHCPTSSDMLGHLLSAPREIKDPDAFIKQCLAVSLGHLQLERYRNQVKKAHMSLAENMNSREVAQA
jgi:hypothetical protein